MQLQPLTTHQANLLREGIALFNRGEFFACHEALEVAWLEVAGDQKRFLQGLIQVAVSFHHLRQGNYSGADRLLRAGMEKLTPLAGQQDWLDVSSLLAALQTLPERLAARKVPPDFPAPVIAWQPFHSAPAG